MKEGGIDRYRQFEKRLKFRKVFEAKIF